LTDSTLPSRSLRRVSQRRRLLPYTAPSCAGASWSERNGAFGAAPPPPPPALSPSAPPFRRAVSPTFLVYSVVWAPSIRYYDPHKEPGWRSWGDIAPPVRVVEAPGWAGWMRGKFGVLGGTEIPRFPMIICCKFSVKSGVLPYQSPLQPYKYPRNEHMRTFRGTPGNAKCPAPRSEDS
jgi:hypothetical protein